MPRTSTTTQAHLEVGPVNLLENGTIIHLLDGLIEECRRRMSQDVPVLLEDAEVGGVAGLAVTCNQ